VVAAPCKKAAVLVSDRVRPRYEEAKIRLFADTRVLEEFEDSGEVDSISAG
jgi:hypothetical protein